MTKTYNGRDAISWGPLIPVLDEEIVLPPFTGPLIAQVRGRQNRTQLKNRRRS